MPSLRVLVVDDEPLLCEMLTECLTAEGWSVSSAAEGGEALRHTGIDVAVVDVLLPGKLAGEAVGEVLEARGVPVLLISGDAEACARIAAAGRPILAKPFRLADLVGMIRELMESRPSSSPVRPELTN
jgi:two-component system OmpR family response regulator